MEAATRLQIFLDRANFGPGKLDGYYGDFTRKALALYRESRGEPAAPGDPKSDAAPDVSGLDLASMDPVFITYTVTDEDLKAIGKLPEAVAEKAKLKSLPYENGAEAVAEKFHSDVDFIAQLNPGMSKEIKAGDQLKVPNVEPFEISAIADLKRGSEMAAIAANENAGDDKADGDDGSQEPKGDGNGQASGVSITVDTKTNMLAVRADGKAVAAYPVTIGSEQTASPIGDWKIRGIAKMPTFRYDEKMLNEGERSDDFHMLPPGPNNPAGVMWIALNREGMGLHGTNDPDSVGRSASHGCVRLANWDVVRLAGKVKGGVPVAIH
ncbi:L,D-transpeptidase [soil metagenome]